MYLNKNSKEIRREFIEAYKHPYIEHSFYDKVLTEKQISTYQQLLTSIQPKSAEHLFMALLHMQTSLDIHDQVDLQFQDDITTDRSKTNQLQVLVGDYHSSYFYRLLSKQNMLDELYHFIETIKEINELKMSILHNHDRLNLKSQLIQVEKIHCGLYDSLHTFYTITDYNVKRKPKFINDLVYTKNSCWISLLQNRSNQEELRDAIVSRKEYWNLLNFN